MLGDPDDAAEAAQETFLRVYQALIRFNGRYHLGAWITRIATNVCLDQLRARSRRPSDLAPLEVFDLTASGPEDETDPEHLFIRGAEGRHVRHVLESLPPLHRAAIVLRDFEGLSYADVATSLELSESQVKALFHRARKGFRNSWATNLAHLLLPWKLIDKLVSKSRSADASGAAAHAAGPSVQTIVTCSSALQQCGQIASERAAALVTAGLVGVAALSSGVAPTSVNPAPPERVGVASLSSGTPDGSGMRSASALHAAAETTRQKKEADPNIESDKEEAVAPEESSEPAPEPTPTSAPPPKSPADGRSEEPAPEVVHPTAPTIWFDRGAPARSSVTTLNEVTADCESQTVSQHLEGTISDGEQTYLVQLDLAAGSGLSLQMRVFKDDREFLYDAGGARVDSRVSDDYLKLEFSGSYGSSQSEHDPAVAGLPRNGRFHTTLRIDCATTTVVTEDIVLTTL